MRDFPSCLGESGVQVADASCSSVGSRKGPHSSVTCVYRCKLMGKSCLINVVWSRNMIGQCFSVEIDDDSSHLCICKVDVKPSLFSKRKGSKCFELNSGKIEFFWDLSCAKFSSGQEPVEGFYIAIVCNGEMALVIGDMRKEAFKKTGAGAAFREAMFISKMEHITGKRLFATRAQFCDGGKIHDLKIECDPHRSDDPCLLVTIDAKKAVQVNHLQWKFRGNETILVDGITVDFYWDVHNWLFGAGLGNAVFMFQISESLKEPKLAGIGFCLSLYAWKSE